jgi:plastocyanin
MRPTTTRLLLPLSLAAAAQAAHHDVSVGKGGKLKFEPEEIKAERGDTITYHFYSKVRTSCHVTRYFC